MNYRALGEKLKGRRLNAGLTQEQVAVRSRVSSKYMTFIEKGSKHASLDVLERVAAALGARLTLDLVDAGAPERAELADPLRVSPERAAIVRRFSAIVDRLPAHRIDTILEDIALWETKYGPQAAE